MASETECLLQKWCDFFLIATPEVKAFLAEYYITADEQGLRTFDFFDPSLLTPDSVGKAQARLIMFHTKAKQAYYRTYGLLSFMRALVCNMLGDV